MEVRTMMMRRTKMRMRVMAMGMLNGHNVRNHGHVARDGDDDGDDDDDYDNDFDEYVLMLVVMRAMVTISDS